MLRLIQLQHATQGRRVAAVEEPNLHFLSGYATVYELAQAAIAAGRRIAEVVADNRATETLPYDEAYALRSSWQLLPPFDHPGEPARCLVTGTGLTHKASAEQRQAMHVRTPVADAPGSPVTDSMKMYQIGLEGGRPPAGKIG